MKPDRKQPARAAATPARQRNSQSSQEPLQSQDWYVIADEGELTLRISDGLRVGEDRWGELTLNHPLSAHRWLEFNIDADGELWCRSSRKDIAVRCDGEIHDEVMLDAGVPIVLPHNRLHISNHIHQGQSSGWQLEVGLLDAKDDSELEHFDDPVDTQADVTPVAEPTHHSPANDYLETDRAARAGVEPGIVQPQGQLSKPANNSLESFIPTLETVAVAPRKIASDEAGPAIERAVAKLKNRSIEFGHSRTQNPADSTESALVPVDAAGPFHTEEIRAALQQPINVGEPGQQRNTADDHPIYAPTVTNAVVTAVAQPPLRLIAAVAIILVLILGAALIVAITATPDGQLQGTPASGSQAAGATGAIEPTANSAAITAPSTSDSSSGQALNNAQPVASNSASRITSLLQTASALLSNPVDLQPDTLDFAIRSLNLVLAAQPQNLEAQRLLASAEQIRNERNKPTTAPSLEPPTAPAVGDPVSADSYSYSDPRLINAARLIAQGAILAPRENSAITLIMSVLAEDPGRPEAVRLLNRSASVLVAQADEEYETLGVFAARNTLEEVLSFHPNHGPANQRWRAWVDTGSPTSSVPQVTPQPLPNLEDTP